MSSKHGRSDTFFFTYAPRSDANVALADGSVHFLPIGSLSTERLRKILQIGACRVDEIPSHDALYEEWHWNWPNIAALAVWLLSVGVLLTRAVRSRNDRRRQVLNSE